MELDGCAWGTGIAGQAGRLLSPAQPAMDRRAGRPPQRPRLLPLTQPPSHPPTHTMHKTTQAHEPPGRGASWLGASTHTPTLSTHPAHLPSPHTLKTHTHQPPPHTQRTQAEGQLVGCIHADLQAHSGGALVRRSQPRARLHIRSVVGHSALREAATFGALRVACAAGQALRLRQHRVVAAGDRCGACIRWPVGVGDEKRRGVSAKWQGRWGGAGIWL